MTETELFKELDELLRDKDRQARGVPFVAGLLDHESVRIRAKALRLLGETGLAYPESVQGAIPAIASFFDSSVPLLRERAVNAVGRIGRGSFSVIGPYWSELFRFAADEEPRVRLSFIRASENAENNSDRMI